MCFFYQYSTIHPKQRSAASEKWGKSGKNAKLGRSTTSNRDFLDMRLALGHIDAPQNARGCFSSEPIDGRGTSLLARVPKGFRAKGGNRCGKLILFFIMIGLAAFGKEVSAAQTRHPSDGMVIAQADPSNPAPTASQRVFRDCVNCPEMVGIPAGKFTMGSPDGDNDEKPAHEIHVDKPIAVGRYEITFDEWEGCVKDGGCVKNKQPGDEGWGRARRPVINISWNDAKEYVDWLSRKTGKPYRLLSEAEWEYAARAGTTTKYAFGDTLNAQQARFSGGKQGAGETAEVGSFPPNNWGLYDMHGNVWEWVEDCYAPGYDGAPTDGSARTGPDCGGSRVLRGGSWDYGPEDLRSALRYRLPAFYRVDEIGFRVAREF
jgi:formylglycine-generating enzyme required for sulfatase activity